MGIIIILSLGGGFFSFLVFIHFMTDWIFQSHTEAMTKHNNAKIRAKHCVIYTIGFIPLLSFCWGTGALIWWQFFLSLSILFISHFYLDTYHGVYLWAKYIRKPPEMTEPIKQSSNLDGYINVLPPDPKAGFVLFIQITLGKILLIAIDQIFHLFFLFPIVCFVVSNIHVNMVCFK